MKTMCKWWYFILQIESTGSEVAFSNIRPVTGTGKYYLQKTLDVFGNLWMCLCHFLTAYTQPKTLHDFLTLCFNLTFTVVVFIELFISSLFDLLFITLESLLMVQRWQLFRYHKEMPKVRHIPFKFCCHSFLDILCHLGRDSFPLLKTWSKLNKYAKSA